MADLIAGWSRSRRRNVDWRTTTSYLQDMQLMRTPQRKATVACLVLVWAGTLARADEYTLSLLCLATIGIMGAISQNLLIGYAGQISLGMAGFLAAGAFTTGILATQYEVTQPLLTLSASILVGGLLGLVVGLPSLRVKGLYLAVSTLALHFVVIYFAGKYQHRVTGGAGINLPDPVFGSLEVDSQQKWFVVLTFLGLALTLMALNLKRGRSGRAWMAVRDRDVAAVALGVNLTRYKLLAFIVSSAMAAGLGSIEAYYSHFVSVEKYTFFLTIQYIAMIVIGGLGTVLGSILGGAFVVLLPYWIDSLVESSGLDRVVTFDIFPVQFAAFGLLIGAFLIFEPLGLTGIWRRIKSYVDLWPYRAGYAKRGS